MRGEGSLLVVAALLCGCPGSIDDPARFAALEADCPAAVDAYLAQACGSACHSRSEHQGDLDLQTLPLDRLVGVTSLQAGCEGHPLVDPDDPGSSLLYLKLASDSPPCGERMPLVGSHLDAARLDCVLEWIASQQAPLAIEP